MMKKYLTYILICLAVCAIVAGPVYAAHSSAEKKLTQYEEALAAANITFEVTTPTGELEGVFLDDGTLYEIPLSIPIWVYKLFTEEEPVLFYDVSAADPDDSAAHLKLRDEVTPTELSLTEYVKDVQCEMSQQISKVSSYSFWKDYGYFSVLERYYAYGITSLAGDPLLASEEDCEITWFEGYDESVFAGDGLYCLVPASKLEQYDNGNGEAVVSFYYTGWTTTSFVDGELVTESVERECPYTMKIVGTYTGGDWTAVYCPLAIVEKACIEVGVIPKCQSLSATLADNSRLDEFREKMSFCFLEPSPENEDIPWGFYARFQKGSTYHKFYPLGLAIDADDLDDLPDVTGEVKKLESIVKIGVIVLAVTVAAIPAGCLVIFISNKKKAKAE